MMIKKYQWREIGESEWMDCTESWYEYCLNSPIHDTRIVNNEI
jgi:hypothetical protein